MLWNSVTSLPYEYFTATKIWRQKQHRWGDVNIVLLCLDYILSSASKTIWNLCFRCGMEIIVALVWMSFSISVNEPDIVNSSFFDFDLTLILLSLWGQRELDDGTTGSHSPKNSPTEKIFSAPTQSTLSHHLTAGPKWLRPGSSQCLPCPWCCVTPLRYCRTYLLDEMESLVDFLIFEDTVHLQQKNHFKMFKHTCMISWFMH